MQRGALDRDWNWIAHFFETKCQNRGTNWPINYSNRDYECNQSFLDITTSSSSKPQNTCGSRRRTEWPRGAARNRLAEGGVGIRKEDTCRNPGSPPRHSSPGPELAAAVTTEQRLLGRRKVTRAEIDLDRRFHIQRARLLPLLSSRFSFCSCFFA